MAIWLCAGGPTDPGAQHQGPHWPLGALRGFPAGIPNTKSHGTAQTPSHVPNANLAQSHHPKAPAPGEAETDPPKPAWSPWGSTPHNQDPPRPPRTRFWGGRKDVGHQQEPGVLGKVQGESEEYWGDKAEGETHTVEGGTRDGKGKWGTVGTGGPKEAEPRAERSSEGTGNPPPPRLSPFSRTVNCRRFRSCSTWMGQPCSRRPSGAECAMAGPDWAGPSGDAEPPQQRRQRWVPPRNPEGGAGGAGGAAGAAGPGRREPRELHRRAAAGNQLCATCPRTSQWPRRRFVLVRPPGS